MSEIKTDPLKNDERTEEEDEELQREASDEEEGAERRHANTAFVNESNSAGVQEKDPD
ncbi:hypothetical protein ACN469_01865 [Corallococcus terminator]